MIYGLNFNNKPIPNRIGRRFAKKLRLGAAPRIYTAILQGVCNRDEERDAMLLQAQTATRKFYITELRQIGGARWMAFYSYHVPEGDSEGIGWPCHSFISAPIFRRLGLGKDVQIRATGIVLRKMMAGKYTYIERSWDSLLRLPGKKEIDWK